MNIKNTTKFSKEAYYTLNKTLSSKTLIVCILFELVLAAILALFIFKDQDYIKAAILGVLMIAYPFLLTLIMNSQIKKNYEINKLAYQNMIYNYVFEDKELLIQIVNKNESTNKKMSYQAIYKVIESDKFLFIFVSSTNAYLIEKSCFENDEDLNKVIEKIKIENIKYKYKKMKIEIKEG